MLNLNPKNRRPEVNGPGIIPHGVVVCHGIEEYSFALKIAEELAIDFPDHSYEVTGVQGNYKIIERKQIDIE